MTTTNKLEIGYGRHGLITHSSPDGGSRESAASPSGRRALRRLCGVVAVMVMSIVNVAHADDLQPVDDHFVFGDNNNSTYLTCAAYSTGTVGVWSTSQGDPKPAVNGVYYAAI